MKIVIVDDDILVSSALKTILEAGGEVEVTGTGQDGKDAVRLYDELLPDVLHPFGSDFVCTLFVFLCAPFFASPDLSQAYLFFQLLTVFNDTL